MDLGLDLVFTGTLDCGCTSLLKLLQGENKVGAARGQGGGKVWEVAIFDFVLAGEMELGL